MEARFFAGGERMAHYASLHAVTIVANLARIVKRESRWYKRGGCGGMFFDVLYTYILKLGRGFLQHGFLFGAETEFPLRRVRGTAEVFLPGGD